MPPRKKKESAPPDPDKLVRQRAGIYRTPYALMTRRLWPARGMVVDPGLHVMGWSRGQVIDFIRQSGRFSGGLFQVLQSRARAAKGLTELRLKGSAAKFRRCRSTSSNASASRLSRRAIRRLRGNARGRFRTRGRHSAATVRGTVWEVTDRCDGTLTKVRRGKVAVRDFRRRKTIVVRAGKQYLARARP